MNSSLTLEYALVHHHHHHHHHHCHHHHHHHHRHHHGNVYWCLFLGPCSSKGGRCNGLSLLRQSHSLGYLRSSAAKELQDLLHPRGPTKLVQSFYLLRKFPFSQGR